MSAKKKILCLNRKPPHGTIFAQEALDVALIVSAFDQAISLAFVDDGVYQLLGGQDTRAIETKNFPATFAALGDYDVRQIYVEAESLQYRGIDADELLAINYIDDDDEEHPAIEVIDSEALRDIIDKQDVILSF